MNARKFLLYAHLALAAFFMPLLLTMPTTGALYILGYQGDQTKTETFTVSNVTVPEDSAEQEKFFRDQFAAHSVDYDFEYIRGSKTDFTFRPTTRVHYTASLKEDNSLVFTKVEPNLLKRLIELHKGHGPLAMRGFEVVFGIALILTTLSGLWLAWTVKPYRKVALIAFSAGAFVILLCLV